jgi:hypothetical protein
LSFNGVVEGTPQATGSFSVLVRVTDSIGGTNGTSTKQLSLFIGNDNGGSTIPVISRVKVKNGRKLWVFGQNFEAGSVISLNGIILTPKEFTQEGSIGKLFFKKNLPLRTDGGPNAIFVRNSSGWSSGLSF